MPGAIRGKAFGFHRQGAIRVALKHVLTAAKLQGLNCLEIDKIASHSFLGMPYIIVSGYACQIQAGASSLIGGR